MRTDTLLVQIRSLEAQLAVLRARLKQADPAHRPFAAFYGVLTGIVETTEQEIEAAKLRIKAESA